jgi:hypothetical protein
MSENVTYEKEKELAEQMNADSGANADFPIEVPEAMKIVGIGKEEKIHDLNSILAEYGTTYWVHHENGELQNNLPELIDAKNILVRTNLLLQVYDSGAFVLPEEPPFENACPKCHGTGELYLFNRTPKEVKCNRCEDGKVWVRCRSCKGTGRYKLRFKEGGGINVECRTCKDSPSDHKGQIQVKCRICKGTTIAKIMVLDHSLKSTTPCPVCHELGFTFPEKVKAEKKKAKQDTVLDNPVLAGDLAEKLKQQIDDNKFFNNSVEDKNDASSNVDEPVAK